jgi:hypothetical protein
VKRNIRHFSGEGDFPAYPATIYLRGCLKRVVPGIVYCQETAKAMDLKTLAYGLGIT